MACTACNTRKILKARVKTKAYDLKVFMLGALKIGVEMAGMSLSKIERACAKNA